MAILIGAFVAFAASSFSMADEVPTAHHDRKLPRFDLRDVCHTAIRALQADA